MTASSACTDDRRRTRRRRSPSARSAAPLQPARAETLPDPSDWTFELIEQYHEEIRARGAALRARHLSEPARGHHRRADDGCLCLGRHAGELSPLVLRQAFHRHREELPARPDGAGLRDRHQLQSLHRLPDGGEHDWRCRRWSSRTPPTATTPSSRATTCSALWTDAVVDHRLPGLRQELHRRVRGAPRHRGGRGRCSTPAMRCRTTASTATAGRAKLSLAQEDARRKEREAYLQRRSTTCGAPCRKRAEARRRGRRDASASRASRRRTCCTSSRRTRRCWSRGSARSCASCARSRSTSIRSARRR